MIRTIGLAIALAVAIAQPVAADVIVPGPPLVPMDVSRAEAAKMAKSARAAVARIFDFSSAERPPYLDEAYRAAGKRNISGLSKVTSVVVLGDRAYILAVTDNWLAPQTIGQAYTYFQCKFDDNGDVVAIDIMP